MDSSFSKITTPENTFMFTEESEPFIREMFERDLIWFCGNCGVWHITVRGEKLGVEMFLTEALELDKIGELPDITDQINDEDLGSA